MWELSAKLESCLDNIKRQQNNSRCDRYSDDEPARTYWYWPTQTKAQYSVAKPGINSTVNAILLSGFYVIRLSIDTPHSSFAQWKNNLQIKCSSFIY